MRARAAQNLSPAYPARAPWGTAELLRAWQQEALEAYRARGGRDFLAVATPGAGKTTFALRVASQLLEAGIVRAVTVVAPTEHLKHQWTAAAHRVGIELDPGFRNATATTARDYTGVALTYAGVAAHPALHRNRTEARTTLVILDEIHHAGDSRSWGEAIREAFEPATRRLGLTGTPFRTDVNPIPFVDYVRGADGIERSVADHTYGYGQALADHVVRPVVFHAYAGDTRWRTRAGDELAATLGEPMTADVTAQAWRTALAPDGQWVPAVLRAADRRLTEIRRHVGDAGAMVIATDHASARGYARLLRRISGEDPTVVLSDDGAAGRRIEQFAEGRTRWLVAVRMVSEGVDIPRLAVGVYAAAVSTPLFFAQAVGRFVRARRRGELASMFLPSIPVLLRHAAEIELERDHVLGRPAPPGGADADPFAPERDLVAAAGRAADHPDGAGGEFAALDSAASFDRVLYDGGEFGLAAEPGSAAEQDYLGLPGLLEPDDVAELLRKRQAQQIAKARRSARAARDAEPVPAEQRPVSTHQEVMALRRELHGLVGAWHHRTGHAHSTIHAQLRRECGGPPVRAAGVDVLRRRIALVRRWAAGTGPRP